MKGASSGGDGPETDNSFARKSLRQVIAFSIFSERSMGYVTCGAKVIDRSAFKVFENSGVTTCSPIDSEIEIK